LWNYRNGVAEVLVNSNDIDQFEGKYPVLLAVIVTIAVGISASVAGNYGFNSNAAVMLSSIASLLLLFYIFPESGMVFTRLSIFMPPLGVISAFIYISIYHGFHVQGNVKTGLRMMDYMVLSMGTCIVTPFFEETVVRRLLFLGICRWFGDLPERMIVLFAALIVSGLFSLVHRGMETYAFIFSLIMCFMTWKGVHTVNRSILHGTHNFVVLIISLNFFY
jgi:Type II CAAX prenyl endopeptidase Rce1-like